jgi:DNA-binding XRE family transcriptional regulator
VTQDRKNPAEQLAREIAREAAFLPERWRVWLYAQLGQDLKAADMEQHRLDVLNARMSEAVKVLERVAQHLKLTDQSDQLTMTMAQFDATPDRIREGWKARRVADAVRRSWALAKGVAFDNVRLPVAAERKWEQRQGLSRKRRESQFALGSVQDWLVVSEPAMKTRAAYDRWSKQRNQELKPGQKHVLQAQGVQRYWRVPWEKIVAAVEQKRSPGETDAEDQLATKQTPNRAPAKPSGAGSKPVLDTFVLDPGLRAKLIENARREHGWTIKELARRVGIDPSTLAKIERGKARNPSLETIAKLAHALDLSLTDFVTASD